MLRVVTAFENSSLPNSANIDGALALNTANSNTDTFWDTVTSVLPTTNEAEVERQIVLPLLAALGFGTDDIATKVSVQLTQGTKRGRPFEADFVTYSAALHDRDTSLMVVEVKAPGESLEEARKQGESYAVVLRAPALLLTNGVNLQIWQLQRTLENKLVFECSLSDIKAQRGSLEQLIGKQALVAHATNLAHKKLTATPDFGAYESAEIARTQDISKAIARVLFSENREPIISEDLLDRYPKGAIISAPSGYGKTTMAAALLRQGIKHRWEDSDAALPIDLPLVDLDASKLPLLEFVHARIVAHHPQVTVSAIQDMARNRGLLLVCDGYERIGPGTRPTLESQLRQITRDFPKSKLFVFSRGSVVPQLALPRVQLQPLNHTERQMMAEKLAGIEFPLSLMPRLLMELSEIPLILERIISFWIANRRFPARLEELFEHWVRQLLGDPSTAPAAVALRSKVLLAFARELGARHLTPIEALELTIASGGDPQTYDALVQCGALLMSTTSVEFVHEGLADHLRARALAALPESALRSELSSMKIDEESLLPVLLAALVKDPASRAYVWERLREMSLPRYIDAIRFSEDAGEPFTALCLPVAAHSFTEDMAASIEALIDAFFPSIATELRGCLAHQLDPVDGLCLIANIAPGPNASLTYSLQPSATNTVRIASPSPEMSRRYLNLSAAQIGVRDGRYMGAIAVRDALNDLVRNRRFHGGVTLANERTIGRLRFMHEEYDFPVDPQESLSDLLQRLQPIKHMAVVPGLLSGSSPAFMIANMIGDLELLLAQRHKQLDWWWLQYGTPAEIVADRQRTEGFLREHYRRTMALYSEIVSASFGRVSNEFSLFRVAPVRWQLAIRPSRQLRPPSMSWRWLPVATEGEAGVDITHYNAPTEDLMPDEAHTTRLIEALGRLGRNTNRYSIGGFGQLPNTGTRNWRGQLTGDTSAMRHALDYLEDDVKHLFGDLPARGPTLGDIPLH